MGADDRLDQDHWLPGGAVAGPRPFVIGGLTVDQQIRSTALLAAATWLASETFTHPERRELLTVASTLAGWIRDGSPVDPNPRPRPTTSTPRQEATPT